ncbi:AMP-binding protein [Nocardiopsis composta]|uniref:Acyl-CoA synthetase (AMP-forming)/AMP-acid ligase II n=1 Tax=Nocardiopsis composta TaxID=157465 RepID=A0A7W8VFZ7_9ACTN|nr:AMP-binding protein [Nocardiopsis composta]MBB5435086.1 acyl-CoA synthetase (AMP-forming)/AMP-acid ligase II [Nocardiopsis composta]
MRHHPVPASDGGAPAGSLTGGLLDRLRSSALSPAVSAPGGQRIPGAVFASTVERAAAGLRIRGSRPGDVTAVLCPHSPDRLMALFTVLAADGAALPLCADTPSPALVHLLTATETRMVIADASLAGTALQLADRSRVRQVLAFGRVPGTTPFDELLLPGPAAAPDALAADIAGPPSGARGGRAEGALLDHRLTGGRLRTVLHTRADLLRRRAELQRDLDLGAADTVALDPLTPERDRIALTAAALWSGASVSTIAGSENPPEATVRSSPAPSRIR